MIKPALEGGASESNTQGLTITNIKKERQKSILLVNKWKTIFLDIYDA